MELKNSQNAWNFIFSLLFVSLLGGAGFLLFRKHGSLPQSIPLADFLLITLATFRLTRLFVYDKITRWLRDMFTDKREAKVEGVVFVERIEFLDGPRRTISDLLSCPWCISVWFALLLTFLYFLSPLAWFFILVLAISGLGALLQLSANMIGWSAEYRKLATKEKE